MKKNKNFANLNFFSYSTEAPIDMGPPGATNFCKKAKRQKWEKSSPKNKNDSNKSIEFFGEDVLWFGFHHYLAEKKSIKFWVKTFCFLNQI